MSIQGYIWKFGDNIDTDAIMPAKYLNISDSSQLAMHCMEGIDPNFANKVSHGDIIVAGKNFGCGSSREHAPLSIKKLGISAIIAHSFARIFYRNAFNMGLTIIECPEASEKIQENDQVAIDLENGIITNQTKNESYKFPPFPEFMRSLLQAGGLLSYIRRQVSANL